MINYIYPIFKYKRIMKKEMLTTIRDYAFDYNRIMYKDYTKGILTGCEISINDNTIEIGQGIVKYKDILYIVNEEQNINYEPTEKFMILKIKFEKDTTTEDFIEHYGELKLDTDKNLSENEIEICRFKLKKGSKLRNNYQSFEDIQTEYDTVNLAEATYAGEKEETMSTYITKYFAREVLKSRTSEAWDIGFSMTCINSHLPINRSMIEAYIYAKTGIKEKEMNNKEIFENLKRILRSIETGKESYVKRQNTDRKQVIID